MSSTRVFLDTEAAADKFSVFQEAMPQLKLDKYYRFDSKFSTAENFQNLANLSLREDLTLPHLYVYQNVFLDCVSRWVLQRDSAQFVVIVGSLGRICGLYAEAAQLIETFLSENGEYLNAMLQTYKSQNTQDVETVLLAFYRLIKSDKARFEKYIKAEILQGLLSHESTVVRLLALKVLDLMLEMAESAYDLAESEHVTKSNNAILGTFEQSPNTDFQFLELNEAKRLSNYHSLPLGENELQTCPQDEKQTKKLISIDTKQLSPLIVEVCGVFMTRTVLSHSSSERLMSPSDLVYTKGSTYALKELAKGIQSNHPVMLVGKAGSGKTFLINELSKMMDCHDTVVKIHLGEQTDAKLLLGTYTSGEKPGTFEWRSGVLTTAVREGRWVLVEDINKAPTEVLSVLLTLLEKREISIPSRGEVIKAANGFQLLATISLDEQAAKKNQPLKDVDIIGMRLWKSIIISEPSEDELKLILKKRFTLLTALIAKLINTYKAVKEIYENPQFVSLNKGIHPRVISIRDLVKLCQRITSLFEANQISKPDQLIESSVYDSIFSEAVDCFVGSISEYKAVQPLVQTIGEKLEVSASRILLFLNNHVPVLKTTPNDVVIGRASLKKSKSVINRKSANTTSFAFTNHSLRLMEQIGVAVKMCEPTLLVGETGTGKTTVVQELAKLLNKNLTVINVSQQTETGDLLGGFKPVNCRTVAIPIQETFEGLFVATFSLKKNEKFYKLLHKCLSKSQWKNVSKLWKEAIKMASNILKKDSDDDEETGKKKKRRLDSESKELLLQKWDEFALMVEGFEVQSSALESSFVFNFIEGSLVKAVRNGEWLLLDEANLASADILENISDLLAESQFRSVLLSEKGEAESIKAHPDFRIFACMNPATDVGKRDLPPGIRSRFTEVYVHSPDRDISDLLSIIDKYISKYSVSDEWVGNDIAELYLEAKRLAESNMIVDGANQRPHFSIRTLSRTLLYVTDIVHIYGLRRSLYEGFCMSFLTLLNASSEELLRGLIEKFILGRIKNPKSVMSQIPPSPGNDYVQFKHYWMKMGPAEIVDQSHYIITPFVERNMLNLVRATSGRRFPVLIQGPTSAGKTSMIRYLADITGHKFVRINNHEHTDLQEYLGTYTTDETGKLSFKEGILVEALKKGYWIVLDELNLAPTDVLEALNRLLDDNRELFIPETQEVVHPHPDFMLFATQNPAGIYGGRKVLSRAFRNRFLELHFDDIPQDELEIILKERCKIAPSYAKKIVEVYRQLSIKRSASRLFEQKNSFATLRDLFRWALRPAIGYEELAANGYMLLAERCRSSEEKDVVKSILEKVMKVKLDMEHYYTTLENPALFEKDTSVIWTTGMRRLAVLVGNCLKNNEPVLLVGETGCGKTTIFQILAKFFGKDLVTINAHQNTETGDILGAQRPVRKRSEIQTALTCILKDILGGANENSTLEELLSEYDQLKLDNVSEEIQAKITSMRSSLRILFEWCDGPLVKAMKDGSFFLFDEISLADDSVLERLNSVLETERSLLLAEKGTIDSFITAQEGFQFFATMNPGGDYGKKELSPALKNRFTEIWVPSMEDFKDVETIVSSRLRKDAKAEAPIIVQFSEWFAKTFGGGKTNNGVISLRDILAWVDFINFTKDQLPNIQTCIYHGASMVFIDTLGTNNTAYLAVNEKLLNEQKMQCSSKLSELTSFDLTPLRDERIEVSLSNEKLTCGDFFLKRSIEAPTDGRFTVNAPTTAKNLMRVVRALYVNKPVLLEGSPGVGKTSLIAALANYTGNELTRINLSEQTDLVDLFGFDAPGEKSGEFIWRDAPFLRAMQKGEWVLLDEMNLASQSVLEGLNACLDHRGEAYIPELDKVFTKHPNFLVFAAQNPQYQGGGRKGLPKSFVNRFSVVYVDMLTSEDLLLIATHMYPNINSDVSSKMIQMMSTLEENVSVKRLWGSTGAPWEFNLRDTLRWLKLLNTASIYQDLNATDFLQMLVKQRFRTEKDQAAVEELIQDIFGELKQTDNYFKIGRSFLQANAEVIDRNNVMQPNSLQNLIPLQCNFGIYETVIRCIKHNWPLILTGPTNSGKSDIIKFVASVIGKKTVEFSMNSDVDSMDILGGYEQLDLNRKVSNLIQQLQESLTKLIIVNLSSGTEKVFMAPAFELFDYISQNSVSKSNFSEFMKLFRRFHTLTEANIDLDGLRIELELLENAMKKPAAVKFEWFDGILVKAVEEGHWLILDNANLCSPSVLDRINSLLETDGSLIINECSLADGKPRVVMPHPEFRLFLTVDPRFGELSRAMRNRGVEVFVGDLSSRASLQDKKALGLSSGDSGYTERGMVDSLRFMTLSVSRPSKIPLTSFLSPRRSKLQSLASICDMILADDVSGYLVSTISLETCNLFECWTKNCLACNLFSEAETVSDMESIVNFLCSSGKLEEIKRIYEPLQEVAAAILFDPVDFSQNQSLMTTLNGFISPSISSLYPSSLTSEAVYFHALIWYMLDGQNKLNHAQNKANNGKVKDLSYLELSAAHFLGQNVKNPPNVQVYKLLYLLIQYIVNSMKRSPIFRIERLYETLFTLYALWLGVFNCSKNRDEAKLRVYQELLLKWSKNSEVIIPEAEELKGMLLEIANSATLNTGQSMSLLWAEFRKIYPSNQANWDLLTDLQSLSSELDNMVKSQFTDGYETIGQFYKTFFDLYQDILKDNTSNLKDVFQNIHSGISNLESISSTFLIKRKHYFLEEFDMIVRFLLNDFQTTRTLLYHIAPNSSLSCMSLIELENQDWNYPPVLNHLWEKHDGRFISHTKSLFTPALIESIIQKCDKFGSFSGGIIDQTIRDAKTLTWTLVNACDSLVSDQTQVFSVILRNWVLRIIALHTMKDSKELNTKSLEQLYDILISSESTWFTPIFKEFLAPALYLLQTDKSIKSLGKAWVLFAVGLLQLYVPSSPLDPAIQDHVVYDNFFCHKALTESIVNNWKVAGSVLSGQPTSLTENLISQSKQQGEPEKPRVYRPNRPIDTLFDEWSAFMSSTVDITPVMTLLESAQSSGSISLQKQDMFEQNTSQFLSRLSTNYHLYSDINDIFAGYVYAMKMGFNLISLGKSNDSKTLELSPLFAVDSMAITDDNFLADMFYKIHPYIKEKNVNCYDVEELLIYFMDLCNIHRENPSMLSSLNHILEPLYYRWSHRRIKAEQEAEQKSSLFKFSDQTDAEDAEFKRLFPSYEDSLSLESETSENVDSSLPDLYFQVACKYIEIFEGSNSVSIKDIVKHGSRVSAVLLEQSSDFKMYDLNESMILAAVSQLSRQCDSFSESANNAPFDFYRGSSMIESKKAMAIIEKLWSNVDSLSKEWPEHATLQDLCRVCQEFMTYPISTPMARLLQKLEQIYTFVVEWQKYASSKVSLQHHVNSVTNLIVSWRRLELHTWKSLFEIEDLNTAKSIGSWWFYLFETIIASADNDDFDEPTRCSSLLSALNIFFSKSTFGEIYDRLRLVKAFYQHVSLLLDTKSSVVKQALQNIIAFYEQFVPIVDDTLKKGRKSLEKEISEVILLASWKDVNIDALKQSSHRSHNSLFKIVRKYRMLLSTPFSNLIETGIDPALPVKGSFESALIGYFRKLDLSTLAEIVNDIPGWNDRSRALKDIDLTDRNLSVYVKKIKSAQFPSLLDFAKSVSAEAKRLREETPTVYKKDKKKLLATLKTQKRKILSDTFKELKRIGLKANYREDIRKVQESVVSILTNSRSLQQTPLCSNDVYFFRILDLLPRLKNAVSCPSDDVPIAYIEKFMAMVENLVFSLIATRQPLSDFAETYSELEELRVALESVSLDSKVLRHSHLISNMNSLKHVCRWLPQLLDYIVQFTQSFSSSIESKAYITFISDSANTILEYQGKSEKFAVYDNSCEELLNSFTLFLHGFASGLSEVTREDTRFLTRVIVAWLEQNWHQNSESLTDNGTEPAAVLRDIELKLRQIHTAILLSVQKLTEDLVFINEEQDKWLVDTNKRLIYNMKLSNSSKIVTLIKDLLNTIKSHSFSAVISSRIIAAITFTMPVINHYFDLLNSIINSTAENYYNTTKATYLFATMLHSLAKDGFCSPEPPSEETEDNNLQEGTGLGDGDGANNNSKDVEEDEDLLEDAQQPNKDKKDKDSDDEDEDDEAVEMEGDIAGDLENASDQEDEDSKSNDEEENEDLDEEIDDLDEDDPNALDEKMWEEEADEGCKEKESENMPNESNPDDVQASEEQNDNNNSDKQKEDQENPEGDKEEIEGDSEGEDEADVGEQEDEVRNDENDQLEPHVPDVETMELPDDMNLDDDKEDGEESDDNGDVEDKMDVDEEEDDHDEGKEEGSQQKEADADTQSEGEDDIDANDLDNTEEDVDMDQDPENHDENENSEQEDGSEQPEIKNEEVASDDELDSEHKDQSGQKDENQDIEGLDGLDNVDENIDQMNTDAAVEQDSGSKGEGSNALDSEEKQDIGSSGNAQTQTQENNEEEIIDASRKQAQESLKQLGDSLKEFHRRHQEIKEASTNSEDQQPESSNQIPDDFEHVDGANTDMETQALGSAEKDQLTGFDEDLAIDDDMDDANIETFNEEVEEEKQGARDEMDVDVDEVLPQGDVDNEDNNGKSKGAFIGDRNTLTDTNTLWNPSEAAIDQNDIDQILEEVDNAVKEENIHVEPPRPISEARELWRVSEQHTSDLAAGLSEQLRLILEPTLATKLKGDYKTGKRLNMKRIIPYIASQYRKDKIWLKRTKPSKRQYQIMIAVDDSKSMSESKSVNLAFQSICLVSKALTQLESGALSIVKFGETVREVHKFNQQFTAESGAQTFQWFDFQETRTDVKKLVAESIKIFERARAAEHNDLWQLEIIISDGVCEDHETLVRLVRRARENKIMLVFVVIDGISSNESIMDMSQVKYVPDQFGTMKLSVQKYLDTFPFEFYVVVHDISELPEMLSIILRQYFSEMATM